MDNTIHVTFKALRLRHNDFQIADAKASPQPTPLSTIFSGKEILIILKMLTLSKVIARHRKSSRGSHALFHYDFFLPFEAGHVSRPAPRCGPGKK